MLAIFDKEITRWVWDGNAPLHEWKYELNERPKIIVDDFGEINTNKPEPAEKLITWIFDESSFKPSAKLEDGKIQSIVTDYLGTPVEMFDKDGNQSWSVDYDIYGKIRKQYAGKTTDCPFRYQGQYEDEETGLYYNRFRYYNAEEGIYVCKDPTGLDSGMAFYRYVKDVNYWIDPFGLIPLDPNVINYSQRTVSDVRVWDASKYQPINVMLVDGQYISYDNRRLLAAQNAGLDSIEVNVVDPNAIHPDSTTGKTWKDQFDKRRKDKRNKPAVPEKGLKIKPKCASVKRMIVLK